MENPDLVLQETGSSPTHSHLNYVPSGDTLCRDAISSYDTGFKIRTYNGRLEGELRVISVPQKIPKYDDFQYNVLNKFFQIFYHD